MARLVYADPPYPPTRFSMARTYYRHDPRSAEVPLLPLIRELDATHDGWAVSTHVPGLRAVAHLLPDDARVCAWVKPFAVFQPGVTLSYSWEPVIIKPARWPSRKEPTVRDWVAANVTLKRGLVGAKPLPFCQWMLSFIGAREGDSFSDLFPGTGAVTRAWEDFFSPSHDKTRWPFTGGAKRPETPRRRAPASASPGPERRRARRGRNR